MNDTMTRLALDFVKLRKEAGLSQQQVADLAGEPCRTFIAHIEQGRRAHINLEKIYTHLQVLFTAIKRKNSGLLDNNADQE